MRRLLFLFLLGIAIWALNWQPIVMAASDQVHHAVVYDCPFFCAACQVNPSTSSNGGGGSSTPTSSVQAFVDAYGKMAYDNSISSGVPYEVTLGQAIVESGYGQSGLTKQANNFFGIKASSGWTGETITMPTREVINGVSVIVQGVFRKYASPQDSFADHDKFLRENSRYAAAFQFSNDPYRFIQEVAKAGYATDPNYAQTISGIIKQIQAYIASKNLFPPSSQVVYHITGPALGSPGSSSTGTAHTSCGSQDNTQTSASGSYKNPFRAISNLTRSRIDAGVDYSGTGSVYAVGNGVITYVNAPSGSGWGPNNIFIAEKLSDGPAANLIVYIAECITPSVKVGDQVTSDTVLGQMTNCGSGIEIGWAGSGDLALAHFDGTHSTALGVNASEFLVSLGAPPGEVHPPVNGTLPVPWPTWGNTGTP